MLAPWGPALEVGGAGGLFRGNLGRFLEDAPGRAAAGVRQTGRVLRPFAALALVAALTACSGTSSPAVSVPAPDSSTSGGSPAPRGDVPDAALQQLLLQRADLPTLTDRRVFSSRDLTSQATPQLALCRAAAPVAPHELASVLAKPTRMGQAQVFEILAVFADAAGAAQAYAVALADARACASYRVDGIAYRVEELAALTVPGAEAAFHYRLTTPSVVSGDVRTLARMGRYLVLVTGYGAPPAGQTALGFQATAMAKAVARLR
jgi:hypothetical protein